MVYPTDFGFSSTSTGLIFLAVLPAGTIAFIIQYFYLKYRVFPALFSGKFGELENHLLPGVVASPLMPIGLFIYAWTARAEHSHWIAPTIGFGLIIIGKSSLPPLHFKLSLRCQRLLSLRNEKLTTRYCRSVLYLSVHPLVHPQHLPPLCSLHLCSQLPSTQCACLCRYSHSETHVREAGY